MVTCSANSRAGSMIIALGVLQSGSRLCLGLRLDYYGTKVPHSTHLPLLSPLASSHDCSSGRCRSERCICVLHSYVTLHGIKVLKRFGSEIKVDLCVFDADAWVEC